MESTMKRALKPRYEPSKEVDELAHRVIGAAIEVHRALGPGFPESVYEEALCAELASQGVPFERQVKVAVQYKGVSVGEGRLDLLVGKALIVELKSVETLAPIHQAQLLSYLKMTDLELGLIINFNIPVLKDGIKRFVLSKSRTYGVAKSSDVMAREHNSYFPTGDPQA